MNQLGFVLVMLASRWTRGLAGWAVASLVIWYVLPAIPAMQSPLRRFAAIAALLLVCLVANWVIGWRRRRRERALAAAMVGEDGSGGAPQDSAADQAAEVAALRDRMREALAGMRRRGRGRSLYQQPWYVLIGPPGAGKTTALLQSGLHFPLAREVGTAAGGPVGGVGGTRLCDWWFADEAVLIDTAGRYTTQDSDAAVDKAGWLGFLDLLRRARPRQPINGVLVVLSVPDLLDADRAERVTHARLVRRRIDEITERLQLRVPVYLVLSKADRLRGFDAYFDDLNETARGQVWGTTFAVEEGAEAFADGFAAVLRRLDDRLVERLQAERAGDRRALIATFPLQVASLQPPIAEFLAEAFAGSRLDPAPWLRGVYLTSATQQGTPIDRLTGLLARSFGIDQSRAPALRPVSGRGYFLARLLREVVLGEAMLVGGRRGRMRRRRVLRAAGFSAVGVATVFALLLLWRADVDNQIAIGRSDAALAAYRQLLGGITLDPVSHDDLRQVAPALDAAADLPGAEAAAGSAAFGLSQAQKLAEIGRLVDRRALDRILLPRLIWRLESQMRAHFDDPSFLYQATRVYLMLGGEGPLDRRLVRAWMQADWEVAFPGTLNAGLRDGLLAALDRLLAGPLPALPLDGALVEAARATFSRVSVAERVYTRIAAEFADGPVPGWAPAEALGPLGAHLFVRPSGQALTAAIPGFLTAAGFETEFERALPATTRDVASESWVLGHAAEVPTDGPHLAALEQAVTSLWVAQAEKAWDALFDDLALAPLGTREEAVQTLYILSSPQSPLAGLLAAIAQQLRPPPQPDRKAGPSATSPGAAGGPASSSGGIAALFTPSARAEAAPLSGVAALDAHEAAVLGLTDGPQPTPIAGILHLINMLQTELAAAQPGNAALPATLQGSDEPAALLRAEGDRQPMPVARWLRQIAAGGTDILGSAARQAASAAFTGEAGPEQLCRGVVEGHYPFDPSAASDASVDDFARLFAPGGALDGYFTAQVAPFVDQRGPIWHAHALGGVPAPVDPASLGAFRRAAAIRDAFFPDGAGPPLVRFTMSPAGATGPATLTVGGTSVSESDSTPVTFTWPVASGVSAAALQFAPAAGQAGTTLSANGPWALFRLLDEGRLTAAGGPGDFQVSFSAGADRAVFALHAASAKNPFATNLLAGFHCPSVR